MTSWCKTPSKPSSGNNANKPYDSAMQSCPIKEENWIDLEYLYADGTGVAGARYRVIDDDSDKVVAEGILDNKGFAHCPLPIYVKNVSYNFFSDPPTVAYRKQPDLNPEYAKVKPGWYERMADSISETGSWVWGTIQGDFNENQTVGQIAANAAITMIPIVDQAGDIRDLIANLKSLIWDKRYDDKWVWVAIVLTLIGFIPFIGSAAKGVLQTVKHGIRTGAKIPLDLLIDVINKFHKGNAIKWLRKLASDLPGHAKTIKETFKTFLANFRGRLVQLAERLPGFLGRQVKESIQSIDEIAKVADKNIDAAVKELQQGLNKALESGVDFERKGTTKTKNTRVQREAEPPDLPKADDSWNKVAEHIKLKDPNVPRRRGIGGAHNADEFTKAIADEGAKIVDRTPHPTIDGVEIIEYKMPKLDKAGKPTGKFREQSYYKSTYDPAKISDEQMMRWGREAAENASVNGNLEREWVGKTLDGKTIRGYTDSNGNVTSFFIE